MSYRLIDSNAIADKYPEVNDMPCVFADLPNGLDGSFIDVQPVVRCKDCGYSDDYYNDGSCYCKHPEHEMRYIGTNWNWYCADGERRTDE